MVEINIGNELLIDFGNRLIISITSGTRKPGNTNKPTSLMPVTVAMMLQADHNPADDIFNYKGVDIHLVR